MTGDKPFGSRDTSWQTLLEGGLQAWMGQNGLEIPSGISEKLGPFAEVDGERQGQLLLILRDRLKSFPFQRLHPLWLVEKLPEEPLLRHWALDCIPPTLRGEVAKRAGKARVTRVVSTPPPAWFSDWFQLKLKASFGNLTPVPWLIDAEKPLTFLASYASEELLLILRYFGLRLFASAIVERPQEELVSELFRLEESQRKRIVGLIRERATENPTYWEDRFQAMESDHDRLLYLSLRDLAEQAKYRERIDDGLRIAYRLPPQWGRTLSSYLREPTHEDYALLETWDSSRLEDLNQLTQTGGLQQLNLEEEGLF